MPSKAEFGDQLMKRNSLGLLILSFALILTSCAGNDIDEEETRSGSDAIQVSVPTSVLESDLSSEETEPEVTEVSALEPAGVTPWISGYHAFGKAGATYGVIDDNYRKILDDALCVIRGPYDPEKEPVTEELTGLYEVRNEGLDYALKNSGFIIEDFDGNGIEELMIFALTGSEDTPKAYRILALYTLDGGEAKLLLEGRVRNSYYMLPEAKIYHSGSGGAANSSIGTYRFSDDGLSIEPVELYYTDYIDDLPDGSPDVDGEYGWFRSYDGKLTRAESVSSDYMGQTFEPAIKADFVDFSPNEYCLFEHLRHRYEIVAEDLTWDEARERCNENGGHLVTIGSMNELLTIEGMIKEEGHKDKIFYVGAVIDDEKAGYVWSEDGSDEQVNDLFWDENEPSHQGISPSGNILDEDRGVVKIKNDKIVMADMTDDLVGSNDELSGHVGFICEYDY